MSERILSFRDLKVYQAAFSLQQEIFETSKGFPKEEIYSLRKLSTGLIRLLRANIFYPKHTAVFWKNAKRLVECSAA